MSARLLLYGATGYSGRRLAHALTDLGEGLVLGGRSAGPLAELGRALGLQSHVAPLEPAPLARALGGVSVVLNAAGPYAHTAEPLARACLAAGVDYLDLSGEWPAFQALAALDGHARAAGVMLMPGVGVGVAISGALLAQAAAAMPGARHLRLGIGDPHVLAPGSFRTMLGLVDTHAIAWRQGRLARIRQGGLSHDFDFGRGPSRAMLFSWPDVLTAPRVSSVSDVSCFVETGPLGRAAFAWGGAVAPLVRHPPVLSALQRGIALVHTPPPERQLARWRLRLVAEAEGPHRRVVRRAITTADCYTVTDAVAGRIARAVLAGRRAPGFQVPAGLFAPDWLLDLPSIEPLPAAGHAAPTLLEQAHDP